MPALLDARRALAALTAVALATALIAVALVASASLSTQMRSAATVSIRGADVVVSAASGPDASGSRDFDDQLRDQIAQINGVASVQAQRSLEVFNLDVIPSLQSATGLSVNLASSPELSAYTRLTSGRLPTAVGETAVSSDFAEQQGLSVGSVINLKEGYEESGTKVSLKVVGVISPGPDATSELDLNTAFVVPDQLAALNIPTRYQHLYITLAPGADVAAVTSAAEQAARGYQDKAVVRSADQTVTDRASAQSVGGGLMLQALNILAPVCALVAAIVISTVFTTLVTRQTRYIGLVRAVGATRGQVMLAVLRTGGLIGLVGAVVGVATGAGVAAGLIASGSLNEVNPENLTVSPLSLTLAAAAGLIVTLVAVLRPARKAARVSPLVALTGSSTSQEKATRSRRIVAALGVVVLAAGAGLTVLGMNGGLLIPAAAGGALMLLGVLAGLPLMLTGLAAALSRLIPAGRLPLARLAARNILAEPQRASASASALLVSVVAGAVLLTTLASAQSSFEQTMAQGSPVDITVYGITPTTDAKGLNQAVESTNGIQASTMVPMLTLSATAEGMDKGDNFVVEAIDLDTISPVVRSTYGLEDLDDNTLIVGGIYHIPDGTEVTLTGSAGTVTLTARVREGWGAVISPATAARLDGDAPHDSVLWARASGDGTDTAPGKALTATLRDGAFGQFMVQDSAAGRTAMMKPFTSMTVIVGGVVALALVITLVGLASTTEVSVLERTRQIGVMRALGSPASQVRGLILTENLVLSLIAGVIGATLGAALGAAATTAAFSSFGNAVRISISLLPMLGVLVLAVAVGALASLHPASKAARVAPVAALAED